eukprot:TRINITY_DN18689_c0_g1_i1.p1 TRINITY_DN18689_c0_g1~~TRINITY_DN18689_c0_g1_i1.p1  ORF type:complete len:501 (+),score=83.71 TRINITY_DN18689_c0_g1_i1:215-1504(+)
MENSSPFKTSKESAKAQPPSSSSSDSLSRQKERRLDILEDVLFPKNTPSSPASQTKSLLSPAALKSRKLLNFNESTSPKSQNVRLLPRTNTTKSVNHTKKYYREIPHTPEQVLDAPEILDDYYLNLLDWGSKNVMAVGLGQNVYLWNALDGSTHHLLQMTQENHVTSVSWDQDAKFLAVGDDSGKVQIWDPVKSECVRILNGHSARVGALSWNRSTITSASRDTVIHNHDLRSPNNVTASYRNHLQEVCGLKWNVTTQQLASGGNDNYLNIWDVRSTQSVYSFTDHTAAVKALAWCPFQSNLLVSGGGTADRTLKFWNTSAGSLINSIDTGSQVCAVQWSKHYHELVSSHGYSQNQLCVWDWPTLNRITQLSGHTSRVLHLVLSPDGTTVCSAAADETLRFWRIFDHNGGHGAKNSLPSAGKFNSAILR